MSHHKWLKQMITDLVRQGWTYRWGGKHLVMYPKDKTKSCITISVSPSDRYGQTNAIKDLRKAGAII